ncbi:MAG: PAS domain S-box protein [Candidatus Acidiferrales bacterium]
MSSPTELRLESRGPSQWEKLTRRERRLAQMVLIIFLVSAITLLLTAWIPPTNLHTRIDLAYAGVVILFSAYAWKEFREIGSIRHFLHGLTDQPSSEGRPAEFQKVFDTIVRSQSRFRELIDSLDYALFTLSPDGVFQVANRTCAETLGVSFQDLIGHRMEEFISEPLQEVAALSLPVLLQKESWSGVVRVRFAKTRKSGYFDVYLHAQIADGALVDVSGVARDVTAQREAELRFTELFESLQEGVFFSSPEGQFLQVNPAMARMLDYTAEELINVHIPELYAEPDGRARLLAHLAGSNSVRDVPVQLRKKDRTAISCLISANVIRDASGKIVRLQGTIVDITARVEMEKRLHNEQEFVRRLISSFPDIICVVDAQKRFTFVSARVQDHLGFTGDEMTGTLLGSRAHPDDVALLMSTFEDMLAGKSAFGAIEFRAQHRDGTWRVFRANASPLTAPDSAIIGVVASVRDITESRRFEQQMVQKEKLAAMGQMIAGVAHELNNPLTAILGVSDILRERAVDDSMRRQTDLVLQQARRAATIVQSLMAFSRPSGGPGQSLVRLEDLARRAVQSQESVMQRKHIEVKFSAAAGLPAVQGDAKLLLQMIQNLIVNAHQAIIPFRDHGVVHVHVGRDGDKVTVTIGDDGPGIPADIIGNIFDPFFTTKRPGGGAGLGLTISMAIAKEHGGTLVVRSTPGHGATFCISVAAAVEEEPILPVRPPTAATSALRGHSVLVVDDEESIRELVAEGLSVRGMAVESVATSEEALVLLGTRSFDVILCDFNLPGLNGDKLFERLRALPGGSPATFVFMTGDLLDSTAQESFTQRGARVVQKPFQLAGLAALLGEALEAQTAKVS